jgi:hypothetical protein
VCAACVFAELALEETVAQFEKATIAEPANRPGEQAPCGSQELPEILKVGLEPKII